MQGRGIWYLTLSCWPALSRDGLVTQHRPNGLHNGPDGLDGLDGLNGGGELLAQEGRALVVSDCPP